MRPCVARASRLRRECEVGILGFRGGSPALSRKRQVVCKTTRGFLERLGISEDDLGSRETTPRTHRTRPRGRFPNLKKLAGTSPRPNPPPRMAARFTRHFPNHQSPQTMSVLVGKSAPSFRAKAVKGETIIERFLARSIHRQEIRRALFLSQGLHLRLPDRADPLPGRAGRIRKAQRRRHRLLDGFRVLPLGTGSRHRAIKGGIEGVTYPLVADINKTISEDYDVLAKRRYVARRGRQRSKCPGELVAYRGLFLIDKAGIVRHPGRQRHAARPLDPRVPPRRRCLATLRATWRSLPDGLGKGDDAMTPDHLRFVSGYLSK